MAFSETAKYKNKTAPELGLWRTGGLDRKLFICWKASSHSGVHSNFYFFLMEAKKEKALSPAQDRKRDNAANLPVSCCTSLTHEGLLMLMIA
jgi:hypothetical protein